MQILIVGHKWSRVEILEVCFGHHTNFITLNTGIACYSSVQKLLSCLFSTSLKIRIPKTIILKTVLHGYETWSHPLREEHKLSAHKNI
jgi:hypothetical protein